METFLGIHKGSLPQTMLSSYFIWTLSKTVTILLIAGILERDSFPSIASQLYSALLCCFYSLYHSQSIASYYWRPQWPTRRGGGGVCGIRKSRTISYVLFKEFLLSVLKVIKTNKYSSKCVWQQIETYKG